MTARPILFLDMDGVLATRRSYQQRSALDYPACLIDSECVGALNAVLDAASPLIVVSSTWRHGETRETFRGILSSAGLRATLHDCWCTPDFRGRPRGEEVLAWLHKNGPVVRYLILDDDADFLPAQVRIQTDFDGGFQPHHVPEALRLLGCVTP